MPKKQYRDLEIGEEIRAGDEFFDKDRSCWWPTARVGQYIHKDHHHKYRRAIVPEVPLSADQLAAFVGELNALCLKYGVSIGTNVETDSSERLESGAVEIGQTIQPKGQHPKFVSLMTVESFPC